MSTQWQRFNHLKHKQASGKRDSRRAAIGNRNAARTLLASSAAALAPVGTGKKAPQATFFNESYPPIVPFTICWNAIKRSRLVGLPSP
jgi:hypothetical protein